MQKTKFAVVLLAALLILSVGCVAADPTEPPPLAAEEYELPEQPLAEVPVPSENDVLEEVQEEEYVSEQEPEPLTPAVETPAPQQDPMPALDWNDLLYDFFDPPITVNALDEVATINYRVRHYELSLNTLNNPAGVEAFAAAIRSGQRMVDMLEPNGFYWAATGSHLMTLTREETPAGGFTYTPGMIEIGGTDQMYRVADSVRSQLSSAGIVPTSNTTVKFISIPGFATGHLFSLGSSEYLAFTGSRYDGFFDEPAYLPSNTLMTTLEVAEIMEHLRYRQVGGTLIPTDEELVFE
ncbi:MAG: hypothetical protein FWE19_04015 [Oscillospiraceae bacterium]|nr:hypothetical protein [Oscillospiraceae bacterium]